MGITLKNNKSVTKNMTIKGDDGVGIKTITSGTPVVTEEKTTTPITVTLTDETTQNFNVEAQNGGGADNALTKPTTIPGATQIVAVDNTNTQTMIGIGDGLSIENNTLKASANGGDKLYRHDILINNGEYFISLIIISHDANIFDFSSLKNYLQQNYTGSDIKTGVNVNGAFKSSLNVPLILRYFNNMVICEFLTNNITINANNEIGISGILNFQIIKQSDANIYDTVIEI